MTMINRGGSIFVKIIPITLPDNNYGVIIPTIPVSIMSSGLDFLKVLMHTITIAPPRVAHFANGIASAATNSNPNMSTTIVEGAGDKIPALPIEETIISIKIARAVFVVRGKISGGVQ